MDALGTAMLVFTALLFGGIVAAVLVVLCWTVSARRKSRFELKRYLQRPDVAQRHHLH